MFARLQARLRHRDVPAVLPPSNLGSLADLHAYYIEQVNEAVAEGREDRIPALVDAYWDEATHALNRGTLGWSDGAG